MDAPGWNAPPGERDGDYDYWRLNEILADPVPIVPREWPCPHCGRPESQCICFETRSDDVSTTDPVG